MKREMIEYAICESCRNLLNRPNINVIAARNNMCPECFKRVEWIFYASDQGIRPNKADVEVTEAVRHNQDKLRVDLIPTQLTESVAKVLTFGAKKYSPNNWKGFTKEQQDEILGSLLRHILEYQKGNKIDSESGLHHLAHAACNIAFILYFEEQNND